MSLMTKPPKIRVALAGLGAIGLSVAQALAAGVEGFELVAVSARDHAHAAQRLADLSIAVPVLPLEDLEPQADLLIESAPAHLLPELAHAFLSKGKNILILSVSALVDHLDLIDSWRAYGFTSSTRIPTRKVGDRSQSAVRFPWRISFRRGLCNCIPRFRNRAARNSGKH